MAVHLAICEADAPLDSPLGRNRGRTNWLVAATWASWLVSALLGWTVVRTFDVNPLLTQGVGLPITIGVLGAFVLTGLAWRPRPMWLIGVCAGSYAGWATTTIFAALNGTPFGYGGMQADAGRMAALVMHFSTTWHNTDAADPSQPAEYPPLYPMILGRISAIIGRPGWMLLGDAQAFLIGLTVVLGFLLWQRLVHPVTALVISVIFVVSLGEPSKAYEALALVVLLPWLLLAVCPPRGRPMNPVLSGVIGGLMVPWFPSLLMASFLGIMALAWYGWRISAERRQYLIRLAITAGVAFLCASWYIVPLVVAYSSGRAQVVADEFRAAGLVQDPLQLVVLGSDAFAFLRWAGVLGAVLLLRRAWWSPPLILLTVGTQVVRALVFLRFAGTGHAFILFYSGYVVSWTTVVAGVLVTGRFVVWLARRAQAAGPPRLAVRETLVTLVAVSVCLIGATSWSNWAPAPRGLVDQRTLSNQAALGDQFNLAAIAHSERRPNGTAVRFPTPTLTFPLNDVRIVQTVDAILGPNAKPLVLSFDQRLFSYQPWPDWLPPDREASSALVRWDSRFAELQHLAAISAPQRFAAATAATSRGRIDVFYFLARSFAWRAISVSFHPAQFSPAQFAVSRFADGTVLVVRRP